LEAQGLGLSKTKNTRRPLKRWGKKTDAKRFPANAQSEDGPNVFEKCKLGSWDIWGEKIKTGGAKKGVTCWGWNTPRATTLGGWVV